MSNKILIVDDNKKNVSLMELLLKHAGYTVVSASNGAEGIEAALVEQPDLILMDIQMPDMNGMQAAHEILANELTRNIPIVGISAYATPTSRQQAMRIGMAGFLEKPINHELFIEQVRDILPKTVNKEMVEMATTHTATVLVVDDELPNLKLMQTLLQPDGYATLAAMSGAEALMLAAEHQPDIILLDVMLPEMDGFEVVRQLKANPDTCNIPIIMITSLDDRRSRLHALELGADGFLTKPLDRIELSIRVRNMLRLKEHTSLPCDHNHPIENQV